MMCRSLIKDLEACFQKRSCIDVAKGQAAYMKHHFTFLGMKRPVRDEVQKNLFKKHTIQKPKELNAILRELWQKKPREFQYAALDLALKYKKLWDASLFQTFCDFIVEKSWWDSVDLIAANLIGPFLFKSPEHQSLMDKWIEDDNLWRRRTALIFQLKWKEKTDTKRLFTYCEKRMHEEEFFIRKAIGWSLREYSKTHPEDVKAFLYQHKEKLSYLSFKQASKYV